MASQNPDDKKELNPTSDGSKSSGKKYRGVVKLPSGRFMAQCGGKAAVKRYIGTYDTADEAAREYDKRARELHGANAVPNFPDLDTDDNSSPATESTLPIATPSIRGVQGVPSGRSSTNIEKKGEKRKHIIDDDSLPATKSTLRIGTSSVGGVAIGSEFANFPSESVCSEVRTTGSIIGSSGSTTTAVSAEPPAAAEEVILPTATNSTLPIATSPLRGVASMSEFASIPSERRVVESVVNPGVVPSINLSPAQIEFADSMINQEVLDKFDED